MGTGRMEVDSLPAVKDDISNSPIYERAEIEHLLDDIVRREMVYIIGREEVSKEISPQLFRLHFYRHSGENGEPIKDSYDFTKGLVTNYEIIKGEY